jgi:MFS family permease
MESKSKMHYGWIVMAGCFILLLYAMGLVMITFSVFIPSLAQQFNLSRTQSSSLMMIQSVTSILVMLFAGRVYKKHSVRLFSFVFGLFGVLGYIIYAFSGAIWMCYLGSIVLGVAQGGATMIPTSIILTKWFAKKRGFALGVATAGSGVASMVFSPIVSARIQTSGTTSAFLLVAAIIAVMAVIVFLLLRDQPADKGLAPYGAERVPADALGIPVGPGTSGPPPGMTAGEARKTRYFYVMVLGAFLMGVTFTSSNNHYVAYLVSNGFDPAIAAFGFSIMGAMGLLDKPLLGIVSDKWGAFRSNFLFYSLWIAAQVFAIWATHGNAQAYIFAILIASGAGLGAIAMPLWISDLFGYKDYGNIYSNLMTIYQLGITLGLILFGIIADAGGTYMISYLTNGAFAIISLILVQTAYRTGMAHKKTAQINAVKN